MKIQYRLLIGILLLVANSHRIACKPIRDSGGVIEIYVLDYPFMNEIANFILTTDTDNLFPQYDKLPFDAEYDIIIENPGEGRNSKKENTLFNEKGSYSISIGLALGYEPYLFKVNGVNFYAYENLVPYFDSCNIKKNDIKKYPANEDSFWHYFWFFEVKDGKVVDAVYFYEPVDDGFDKYDVYDLIHKEYIPYKVWDAKIHPNK